jgi:type I site-specific restriction endonuclease
VAGDRRNRTRIRQHAAAAAEKRGRVSSRRNKRANSNDAEIEKFDKERKSLLQKIREHEEAAVATMETHKSSLLRNVDLAQEWTSKISSFERKDQYLIELNSQAKNRLRHLKHLLLQMRAFLWGGNLMDFSEFNKNEDEPLGMLDVYELDIPTKIDYSPSNRTLN